MTDPSTSPTVVVIGAMRSGTTWLHDLLGAHPDVHPSPVKEPHRFAYPVAPHHTGPGDRSIDEQFVLDEHAYRDLFMDGRSHRHRLESSAMYLYVPGTASRLDEALLDVRLIAVLRDPVARARSAFGYQRLRMFEPLDDFSAALIAEDDRVGKGWSPIWHYRRAGAYGAQLEPFLERFGDRLLVVFAEDMRRDPAEFRRRLGDFLDLDPAQLPTTGARANPSGEPRNRVLQSLLQARPSFYGSIRDRVPEPLIVGARRLRDLNRVPMVPADPMVVAALAWELAPDVAKLEELLGRAVPESWQVGRDK